MSTSLTRRRFTVGEYERMIEAGILGEDDHVELIDGEIVTMAPIGPRHAACVDRLLALLTAAPARDRFVLRVQNPVSLPSAGSQPQPDIALLAPPLSRYAERHPTAQDVLLLIEVADTSAAADRAEKFAVYTRAGIPEVWLVDLTAQTVERYQRPSPAGYTEVARFGRGQRLALLAFPDLSLAVDQILG